MLFLGSQLHGLGKIIERIGSNVFQRNVCCASGDLKELLTAVDLAGPKVTGKGNQKLHAVGRFRLVLNQFFQRTLVDVFGHLGPGLFAAKNFDGWRHAVSASWSESNASQRYAV